MDVDVNVCLECQRTFDTPESVRRHVKLHRMSFEAYMLKWKYENVRPKCVCGCNGEPSWNVALKDYAMYVHGHHAFGHEVTEEMRQKIGEKNSANMKQYHVDHPELAQEKSKQLRSGITPEVEERRIAATQKTYAELTPEDRQCFSERAKKSWENFSDIMHAGQLKASATFKRRSLAGEYDFTERNNKVSETIARMYLEGSFAWATGVHESPKTGRKHAYKASWEPAYMKMLDDDPNVVMWENEFTVIPYRLDGRVKRYLPDFHVTMFNGGHDLVEVKPFELRNTPMNTAKRAVALEFCERMKWGYVEWDIRPMYIRRIL